MSHSLASISRRTFFFLLRVAVGTWLAFVVMVAGHIAWIQSRPATDFVDLKSINVDTTTPDIMVDIDRNVSEDSDVQIAAELSSEDDPSYQPCVTGFRGLADKDGSPNVRVPLNNLMGNCDLYHLAQLDQTLQLRLTYVIELDYGIRKRAVALSEPFKLPVH